MVPRNCFVRLLDSALISLYEYKISNMFLPRGVAPLVWDVGRGLCFSRLICTPRMQVTFRATRPNTSRFTSTPGASKAVFCLVGENPTCSVSALYADARVYGHTYDYGHA